MCMMKTIFINHSDSMSLVPSRSQGSYRKVRNSGGKPRMRENVRESAMTLKQSITPIEDQCFYR